MELHHPRRVFFKFWEGQSSWAFCALINYHCAAQNKSKFVANATLSEHNRISGMCILNVFIINNFFKDTLGRNSEYTNIEWNGLKEHPDWKQQYVNPHKNTWRSRKRSGNPLNRRITDYADRAVKLMITYLSFESVQKRPWVFVFDLKIYFLFPYHSSSIQAINSKEIRSLGIVLDQAKDACVFLLPFRVRRVLCGEQLDYGSCQTLWKRIIVRLVCTSTIR